MSHSNAMSHGKVMLLDMDIRDAWFPHSRLSRALMVSYKWKVIRPAYCRQFRETPKV